MSSPSRVLLVGPTPELSFAAQDLELLAAGHEPEAVWRRDFPTRSEIVAAVRSRLATREFSLLLVWFAEPYDSANLLLLSRRLRVPSLLVVGGYEVTHLPELGYGSLGRLRDRLRVRLALQLASVVLPTSSLLAKEVTALGR